MEIGGSIIGLDFGRHLASVALWSSKRDNIDVIADDTGSRVIPTVVAFRGDEILVGQSALAQQHKNRSNTFENILTLLERDEATVYVPAIDKDIQITDVLSHFFRNIHNQVKEQVGCVVRDCVLSIPSSLDDKTVTKLIAAAQAGGVRIKSTILDSTSILLAYKMDETLLSCSYVLVIDVGWSKSSVSLFNIQGGLFCLKGEAWTSDVCGSIFVELLSDYCVKDFFRRTKIICSDNERAMSRLRGECESAIKTLTTTGEASITVDSLCDGVDYSGRISRARFEDLCGTAFSNLKAFVVDRLKDFQCSPTDVKYVCLGGGSSSIPKILSSVVSVLPCAILPKLPRLEQCETQCVGAAMHGKILAQKSLLDHQANFPVVPCCKIGIYLRTDDDLYIPLVPQYARLPFAISQIVHTFNSHAYFEFFEACEPDFKFCSLGDTLLTVDASSSKPAILSIKGSVLLDGTVDIIIFCERSSEENIEIARFSF